MIQPAFLKKGDTISIVGLAKKIDRAHIETAIKIFQEWGLHVVLGENLFNDHFRFSATDDQRTYDFQQALDNAKIKAIISARGGYGSMRVIDRIDWGKFLNQPKWIIGFSDITAVLGHVFNQGIQCVHGIMPAFFSISHAEISLIALKKLLFGKYEGLNFPADKLNRQGRASGELIGGNLSLLCNIMGSRSDFNYDNKLLFIEEIDEYLYKIDRMLLQLKRAGKFNRLKGLMVGHFTNVQDNNGDPFGKSVEEIILDHFGELNIPVAFGLPVGHDAVNMPLIIGKNYNLMVGSENTTLES